MPAFASRQKTQQPGTSALSLHAHFGSRHETDSVPHLQRTVGNQARPPKEASPVSPGIEFSATAEHRFRHHFGRVPVFAGTCRNMRPEVQVNTPGDIYEQEAERIADEVMRIPGPDLPPETQRIAAVRHRTDSGGFIQRLDPLVSPSLEDAVVIGGEQGTEQETVQTLRPANRQSGREVVSKQRLNSAPGGMPLESEARQFMESRFGVDFSQVQVHADGHAADLCDSVNARAFTYGPHIYFGTREYQPDTAAGKHVLAHELTHVVQQAASQSRMLVSHHLSTDKSPDSPKMIQRLKATGKKLKDNVAPWGGTSPTGANYEVSTDGGTKVTGWIAYPIFKEELCYWCHGHSANSYNSFGYSVYSGTDFSTVISDEYKNVPPDQTQAGDIAVWTKAFQHSAKFVQPVIDGGQLAPDRSMLSTKNGQSPLAVMSLKDIAGVYGGAGVAVFRHN